MEEQDYIKSLLEKFKAGTISDAEKAVLDKWYLHVAADSTQELSEEDRLQTFDTVLQHLEEVIGETYTRRLWPRIAAAASILFVLSSGTYFILHKDKAAPRQIVRAFHDIAPVGNKATLTLSGGQQIILDAKHTGQLAQQGNAIIRQNSNGVVKYTPHSQANTNTIVYNTLTTRGGQYPLQLADGTKVWLNSASSITYPVAFSGNERKVTITGEVYFEVAHDKVKPFLVTTHGQTVQVLGTHFNINAYDDEPQMRTTLFEGSILISKADQETIIKPGQQAQIAFNSDRIKVVNGSDLDQAIAWKNGLFSYEQTDLKEVMKQVSRAYEVQVVYEGNIPEKTFSGKLHRDLNASEILDALQFTKVHFKIDGKKIIVTP